MGFQVIIIFTHQSFGTKNGMLRIGFQQSTSRLPHGDIPVGIKMNDTRNQTTAIVFFQSYWLLTFGMNNCHQTIGGSQIDTHDHLGFL